MHTFIAPTIPALESISLDKLAHVQGGCKDKGKGNKMAQMDPPPPPPQQQREQQPNATGDIIMNNVTVTGFGNPKTA